MYLFQTRIPGKAYLWKGEVYHSDIGSGYLRVSDPDFAEALRELSKRDGNIWEVKENAQVVQERIGRGLGEAEAVRECGGGGSDEQRGSEPSPGKSEAEYGSGEPSEERKVTRKRTRKGGSNPAPKGKDD